MVKNSIQQIKNIKKTQVLYLLLLLIVSSCVHLRYTDYGRPLDFLKSKNNYQAKSIIKKDTASIYQNVNHVNEIELSSSPLTLKKDSLSVAFTNDTLEEIKFTLVEEKHTEAKNVTLQNTIFDKNKVTKRNNSRTQGNTSSESINHRGPGWCDDFWSGFWNFVLKWLLIFICFFIILALIVWGIYLLISLLAGPIAAAIFLAIVLLLFYILLEVS
jgi:small-conductance mechanosensitive channel